MQKTTWVQPIPTVQVLRVMMMCGWEWTTVFCWVPRINILDGS
jgi:hypothetical protein